MNPPGKIKKAPDFMRLLKANPTHIAIVYRGSWWRYKSCGGCQRMFWKNTSRPHFNCNPLKRAYCSKACQKEGQRLLNCERQKRYQKRLAAGLVNHRSVQARRGRVGGRNGRGISRRPKIPLPVARRVRIARRGAAARWRQHSAAQSLADT